jgi:hypothetical protein
MHDYLGTKPDGIQKVWSILKQTEDRPSLLRNVTVEICLSEEVNESYQNLAQITPNGPEITKNPERLMELVNTGSDDDEIKPFQLMFNNPEEKGNFDTEENTAIPQDDAVLSAITLSGATEDVGMLDMPVELLVSAVGPCGGGWEGEFAGGWEGVANVEGTVAGNAGPGLIDLAGTFDATSESTDMTMPNYGIGPVEGHWTRPQVSATIQPSEHFRNRIRQPAFQQEIEKTTYVSNGTGLATFGGNDPCRWTLGVAPTPEFLPVEYQTQEEHGTFSRASFPPEWQCIDCHISNGEGKEIMGPYRRVDIPKNGVLYLTLESYSQQDRQKKLTVNVKVQFY